MRTLQTMVTLGEVLSYSVGVFSMTYAGFYLFRTRDILLSLTSVGITIPAEVYTAILLAYLLLGFLGAGQIWLGLLHRRFAELESEVEEMRAHLQSP